MNNLSWFIYLADVVSDMEAFFVMFGLIGFIFIGGLGGAIATGIYNDGMHLSENKLSFTLPIVSAIIGLIMCFIGVLIPTKETIYLIAASEAGETVATSEQGQEIISDIQEIIDQQLQILKQ